MTTPSAADILPMIKNVSDYLYPFKPNIRAMTEKRLRQNSLRELYRNRSNKSQEPQLSAKLTDWVEKLDKKDLARVLTHKNLFMTTFLHEGINFTSRSGRHFFRLKVSQPKLERQTSVFYVVETEKKSLSELDSKLNGLEKNFESLLRFCDQDGYCDCLSIDPSLNGSQFLAFAKKITDDKAFLTPCRVAWDSHTNTWIWDYPSWFVPGQNYSLASFALSSFERSVWSHFWSFFNLDPRSFTDSQTYKKDPEAFPFCIHELSQFLDTLPEPKRKEIVGDKDKHLDICQKAVSEIETLQNNIKLKKINCDTGSIVLIFSNKQLSNQNIDAIYDKFLLVDSLTFVEYLFYTPYDRIAGAQDIVGKKILTSIAAAISDKKAEDLMKEPSYLPRPKLHKKKAKKPRVRKFLKKPQTDTYRSIAEDVLNNILSELEENSELQTQKRPLVASSQPQPQISILTPTKPRVEEFKTPPSSLPYTQSYYNNNNNNNKKNSFRRQPKRTHSSSTKVPNSNQSTPKIQTSKTSTEVTPKKPAMNTQKFKWSKINPPASSHLDTFDFPPLSNSVFASEPAKFTKLHYEVTRFSLGVSKKVTQKFEKFRPDLERVYSVISTEHPDCEIFIFGSYGNGLAIESSDIDLLITLMVLPNRREIKGFCVSLADKLRESGIVKSATAITSAKIPLVKLETEDYCIDISFDDDEHSHLGLPAMNLVLQSTMTYPGFRELMLLFKHLLFVHKLNCSFRGGLSAYCLFIWALAYFRSLTKPEQDLGLLAEGFLRYFVDFDPITTGIDVRGLKERFQLENLCYEYVVTIDPITGNNVTGGLYQSKEILSLFRLCWEQLNECKDKYSGKGVLKAVFSFN